MDNERMKKIILEMYTGQVNMQDAVDLISEYMIETKGQINTQVLQHITNQMDPFAMQMMQKAVEVSKQYFEATRVTITRVMKPDGTFIYAF
jgi:hypothetical protein